MFALFFVSGLAQTVIVPLLPRMAASFGLSASVSAFVLSVPALAMLAVSVPAGVLSDRLGARAVTLAAGGLLIAGCLAQASGSLGALVAGRVAFGLSYGMLWTAGAAWLTSGADAAPAADGPAAAAVDGPAAAAVDGPAAAAADGPAELAPAGSGDGGRRVGPAVVCSSVGTMIGPALGGLLGHGHTPAALPFTAVAAVAAIVVVALGFAPRPGRRRVTQDPPAATAASVPGGRALVRDRHVAAAVGSLLVGGALSGVTQLLIARGLHADGVAAGEIGAAFCACAVGYIAVSALFVALGPRAHTPAINAIVTGLGAVALVPALVGSSPFVLTAALLLTAAPRGAINVVAYGVAGSGEPSAEGRDGAVFGLLSGAWAGASVLVPVAAGALAQRFGDNAAYLAAIVPSLAVTVGLAAMLSRGGGRGRVSARLRRGGRIGRLGAVPVENLQASQLVERDVAADPVPGLLLDELGLGRLADLAELARAASLKRAAGRRMGRAGDLTLQADPQPVDVVEARHR